MSIFREMDKKVEEANDIRERMSLQAKFSIKICTKHPVAFVIILSKYAQSVLFRSAWIDMAPYWGVWWRDIDYYSVHTPLKKSEFFLITIIVWYVIYVIVYAFFLLFLFRLAREKKWLFLFTILLFTSYLVVPGFIGTSAGFRMRLPAEGIIIMCAFYEAIRIKYLDIFKAGLKSAS